MKENTRFLKDGLNVVNGFEINVISVKGAEQITETSRICAKYFGTISKDGKLIEDFTETGKTAKQIKIICGVVDATIRTTSKLKQLMKMKSDLEKLGFSTEQVEAGIEAENKRIEDEKAAIEEAKERKAKEKERKAKEKERKAKNKELSGLKKIKDQLLKLGLSTKDIDKKIATLLA